MHSCFKELLQWRELGLTHARVYPGLTDLSLEFGRASGAQTLRPGLSALYRAETPPDLSRLFQTRTARLRVLSPLADWTPSNPSGESTLWKSNTLEAARRSRPDRSPPRAEVPDKKWRPITAAVFTPPSAGHAQCHLVGNDCALKAHFEGVSRQLVADRRLGQ